MTSEVYGQEFLKGFGYTSRYLQSRGASKDQAEEMAQAAWVKGWERLDQLRQDCLVGRWVNTIALNEFRHGMRRQAFHEPLTEVCGEMGIDCAAIDAAAILKQCRQRDKVLITHQLQGRTTGEIAALFGVSQTAIRIRLLRARRAARRQVKGKLRFPRSSQRGPESRSAA